MERSKSPRAYILTVVLLSSLIAIAGRLVQPASARLTSQRAVSGNTFSTRNLIAPTNLIANPSGHDVLLSWNPGQNGNGYAVLGVGNGTNSNCTGVTFANLASTTSTAFTDTGRYLPQGTFYCYQVQTTYGTWTSQQSNPVASAQIGFVASSIQMINDGDHFACSGSGDQQYGQAGVLDCGDQFIFTFNQPVNTTTGPNNNNTVCADLSTSLILLGSTKTKGACTTGETLILGTLSGGTVDKDTRFDATFGWGNGNKTLTVTIGTRVFGNKYPTLSAATWTFTPVSTLLSATGGFSICTSNAGGGNCLPSTSSATTFSPLLILPLRAPTTTPTPTPTATNIPATATRTSAPITPTAVTPTNTP